MTSLPSYTDGSKTNEGVGASAVLFQFPNMADPIHQIVLTLPNSAMVYQAETAGIMTVPYMCDSLPIQPQFLLDMVKVYLSNTLV